jgi:hypothetical protein
MKRLGRFPNMTMNVSTLAFATIDQPIAPIVQVTMPEILFVAFIAFIIFLVLVDKG